MALALASLGRIGVKAQKNLLYAAGFVPMLWMIGQGLNGSAGPDPVVSLERGLGLWALRFLLLSLSITPLRRHLRLDLQRFRRALGLLCFYYATVHLCVYIVLDHGFNWREIVADVVKRPYVVAGMLGFTILVALAATSSNAAIAWMGGKAWARLHRLVYGAAIAGAAHFLLLVKSWPLEPIAYAGATAALLAFRMQTIPSPRPRTLTGNARAP
jgi:methionine sulfoxide reductase heme-binding subunit